MHEAIRLDPANILTISVGKDDGIPGHQHRRADSVGAEDGDAPVVRPGELFENRSFHHLIVASQQRALRELSPLLPDGDGDPRVVDQVRYELARADDIDRGRTRRLKRQYRSQREPNAGHSKRGIDLSPPGFAFGRRGDEHGPHPTALTTNAERIVSLTPVLTTKRLSR
ncbi:MAG TPA: hypothetical protein ENK57_20365 [Polyangiaceae bacterium]|nr:hypothetical protein [Polyangiaceae bacterium]